MPARLRRPLVTLLIATHGAVATCGIGLHLAIDGAHDHAVGHGDDRSTAVLDPDDCPVCQFCLRLQAVAIPGVVAIGRTVVAAVDGHDRPTGKRPRVVRHDPRAPPLDRLIPVDRRSTG